MDGAIAKGVKTQPSFHDIILPEVLPANAIHVVKQSLPGRISGNNIWYDGRVFPPFAVAPYM
jgi:hypothetical protein